MQLICQIVRFHITKTKKEQKEFPSDGFYLLWLAHVWYMCIFKPSLKVAPATKSYENIYKTQIQSIRQFLWKHFVVHQARGPTMFLSYLTMLIKSSGVKQTSRVTDKRLRCSGYMKRP